MSLKNIFAIVAGTVALGGCGTWFTGLSDRKNAEEYLKNEGHSVVEYKGHTIMQGRPGGQGILYTDKFVIENGETKQKETVVVGKSVLGKQGITYVGPTK